MKLYAVASLLDLQSDLSLRVAWERVIRLCELAGIAPPESPHISWHVAEGYAIQDLYALLRALALIRTPISAHTVGLGLFPSESPVLYLPVCKNQEMIDLHQALWDALNKVAQTASTLYAPANWMPHITLIKGKDDQEKIIKAIAAFPAKTLDFEFKIQNFAVIFKDDNENGILERFDFKGAA